MDRILVNLLIEIEIERVLLSLLIKDEIEKILKEFKK